MRKPTLAELLGRREGGNWALREDAISAATSTPFFDRVMEQAQGNETFEALLAAVTGPIDPAALPEFPTAECLTPEQVSGMVEAGRKEQEHHLATCPWCRNMLASEQPSPQEFEEILRRAKKAAEQSHHREAAGF